MEDAKVVIVVSCGMVCDVYTNSSDVKNIVLVDHDNLKDAGLTSDKRDEIEAEAIKGLRQIY